MASGALGAWRRVMSFAAVLLRSRRIALSCIDPSSRHGPLQTYRQSALGSVVGPAQGDACTERDRER